MIANSKELVECLFVLLNRSQNRRRVSSHNLIDLLPILKQQESRHGADAELLGYIGAVVDIELDKVDNILILLAELFDLGRNGLARAAPFGKGVDDDELVGSEDGGVELGFSAVVSYLAISIGKKRGRERLTP
jgi:hypothetical protein